MSRETKYSVPDGHWDEDDESEEPPQRTRVEVKRHTIEVKERKGDESPFAAFNWLFGFEDGTLIGWSLFDVEENGTEDFRDSGTYDEIPADVQRAVERELGLGAGELDDRLDLPEHLRGESDGE